MYKRKVIYTIGHSNRSIDEFLRLLLKHDIEILADVRRFPTSKHSHFRQDELKKHLFSAGIEYVWFEKLGGYRRRVHTDSPNVAIKSKGFRNYADHMMSGDFRNEINILMNQAERKRLVLMCAEKFFWKCHRKFISDYLLAHKFEVYHIIDESRLIKHRLSREARIISDTSTKTIIYDVIENSSGSGFTSYTWAERI